MTPGGNRLWDNLMQAAKQGVDAVGKALEGRAMTNRQVDDIAPEPVAASGPVKHRRSEAYIYGACHRALA